MRTGTTFGPVQAKTEVEDFKVVLANDWWVNVSKGSTMYAYEVPKEEVAHWYCRGWKDNYIDNQQDNLGNDLKTVPVNERTSQQDTSVPTTEPFEWIYETGHEHERSVSNDSHTTLPLLTSVVNTCV